jgi:uncharacterized protein YqhQ
MRLSALPESIKIKPGVRWITRPGLLLQKITTKPPSADQQLEVAIRALQEVLRMEKERPDGLAMLWRSCYKNHFC